MAGLRERVRTAVLKTPYLGVIELQAIRRLCRSRLFRVPVPRAAILCFWSNRVTCFHGVRGVL